MSNSSPKANILIVDDDEIDVIDIKRGFRDSPFANHLRVAKDGVEALNILRGADGQEQLPPPYVIILDLNMPRVNGVEFLQMLRADPKLRGSIVFVYTTSNSDRDVAAAYQENIAGYLLKSDAEEDFRKVIQLIEYYVQIVHLPQ